LTHQELSKKQRRDREHSEDHTIDSKYPEWHDKEGHFNYRLGESLGDMLDSSEPGTFSNSSVFQ
jgi:hypothetical protein